MAKIVASPQAVSRRVRDDLPPEIRGKIETLLGVVPAGERAKWRNYFRVLLDEAEREDDAELDDDEWRSMIDAKRYVPKEARNELSRG